MGETRKSHVTCPHCQADVGVSRIERSDWFRCESCGKSFYCKGASALINGKDNFDVRTGMYIH